MSWTDKDSWERYEQGMKMAISAARELGRVQKTNAWESLAIQLERLLETGRRMYNEKPMQRQAALTVLEHQVRKLAAENPAGNA